MRDAALDAAAILVMRRGLTAVSMSEIAQEMGIGRATLYKYFPDVKSLIYMWHERQVGRHLVALDAIAHRPCMPMKRSDAVLRVYAGMAHSMKTDNSLLSCTGVDMLRRPWTIYRPSLPRSLRSRCRG